jgi:hypothetical protein
MAREVWNFDSCCTLVDYQIHTKTGGNGCGDNGHRRVWSSSGSMHCSYQLTHLINVCPWVWCGVTSVLASVVSCIVLGSLRITITCVQVVLEFNLMASCHSQVSLMLSTCINITETSYSCQFEYISGYQQVCNSCQSFKLLWPLSP